MFGPKRDIRTRKIAPKWEPWEPWDYQVRAVNFLVNRGSAALFLDPGLGKTSITLSAFTKLQDEGVAKKMLVIAPLRVCQLVWEQEGALWEQFRHLKFSLLHGAKKDARLQDDSDVFLINPEGISWLMTKFFGKRFPFDTLVIDELTKFKNSQSVRHKALMPKISKIPRKWGLTGTPIPNGYLDLFGQMKILDGGKSLGFWYSHFRDKYFEKDYTGFGYDLRRGGAKAIEKAIKPYVLRMSAEDYLELPETIEDIRSVLMPMKARKIYEEMKKEMIAELEGEVVEAGNAAAVYSKLKQMANGAVYVGDGAFEPKRVIFIHDAKIEALQELVEELAGAALMIGYEFNHDLSRLQKAFGKDVPYIGSGVSAKRVKQIEKAWNKNEIPLMFAHPASAGHGLNLQKGNAEHIGWFSTTWDYELYDQFNQRVNRQGNNAKVIFNHIFIVENTIDNKTRDAILDKGLRQDAFHGALNAEIYQTGKTAASPIGASKKEETDMVKKLSRKARNTGRDEEDDEGDDDEEEEEPVKRTSRRSSRRSRPEPEVDEDEEDEEYEDEDEDDEDEPPRKSTRASKRTIKRKLRGRAADDEESDDEAEEDDEGDDDEEAPQTRARKQFSKSVRSRIQPDDEDDGDNEEEGEDDEPPFEKTKKPVRKAAPAKRTNAEDRVAVHDLSAALAVEIARMITEGMVTPDNCASVSTAIMALKEVDKN